MFGRIFEGEDVFEQVIQQIENYPDKEMRGTHAENIYILSVNVLIFECSSYIKRINKLEAEKIVYRKDVRQLKRKINQMNIAYKDLQADRKDIEN